MENTIKLCTRCGICCLNSPCMIIPIDSETYVEVGNKRIHTCNNLSFKDGVAKCSKYNKVKSSNGACTCKSEILKWKTNKKVK